MAQVQVSMISGCWKIKKIRQKFHILLILTGKNVLKWLVWCVFRVQCVLNPMALVSTLYDKQFLKNQNFWIQVSIKGLKTIKMKWDLCSSPSCIPFYPYTMFQTPMPKPSCQKFRKTLITQKVLVTQSSNIVHCDWHTQKPICADFQAFSNTFPCSNWLPLDLPIWALTVEAS